MTYHRIPDAQYAKLRFQAKGLILKHLEVFDLYGMGLYIPDVAENLMVDAELFCENVRGKEEPITKEMVAYRRRKKK